MRIVITVLMVVTMAGCYGKLNYRNVIKEDGTKDVKLTYSKMYLRNTTTGLTGSIDKDGNLTLGLEKQNTESTGMVDAMNNITAVMKDLSSVMAKAGMLP